MNDTFDILVTLGIVEAERSREIWEFAGGVGCAIVAVLMLCWLLGKFRGPIARLVSFLMNPRNALVTACFVVAVIYGGSKQAVVTPQSHSASVEQTNATATEPVAGTVEYYKFTETTNEIRVALFGGSYTNAFSVTSNQFIYAYDARTSAGSAYQNPTNNPLWVRPNSYSNWVASTLVDSWTPDGIHAAVIATLPGYKSPALYSQWFIGPEANLPAVIVDTTGGIILGVAVITSSSVTVPFTGDDEKLLTGSHTYYLQARINVNGSVLTEYENVASVTLPSGTRTGTLVWNGFHVNRYFELRVISDVEVLE